MVGNSILTGLPIYSSFGINEFTDGPPGGQLKSTITLLASLDDFFALVYMGDTPVISCANGDVTKGLSNVPNFFSFKRYFHTCFGCLNAVG